MLWRIKLDLPYEEIKKSPTIEAAPCTSDKNLLNKYYYVNRKQNC